ncbi:hypothetical protein ACLOJK_029398 [Asimina triloba]
MPKALFESLLADYYLLAMLADGFSAIEKGKMLSFDSKRIYLEAMVAMVVAVHYLDEEIPEERCCRRTFRSEGCF